MLYQISDGAVAFGDDLILHSIDFEIRNTEKIAIVGRNGCGKTTLVNLLMRIYDTTNGNILVDGVDIKEYDYEDYLSLFSTVFQDYQQYSFKLVDYVSSGSVQIRGINMRQNKLVGKLLILFSIWEEQIYF